jgi:manganese/zinc/iron transport system permease protein
MELIWDFFSLTDPNIRFVVFGSILLAASTAIVGTFTFLKKKSLVGDAVAHAILPGVCLAFLLFESKNPFILISGAFITGWFSLVFIDYIIAHSKIKQDTAIGLTLSVFFGIGILLLTHIQHAGIPGQSGLDQFLFGKAAALTGDDLIAFGSIGLTLLFFIILFYKEFKLIAFDPHYAKVIGFPVKRLELLLTTLTVLAIVIGIQTVGVVLMAAMLITPAAAARYWTDKLYLILILAASFGAFSGISGAFISYISPAMPTGPWIVMMLSLMAVCSFLFAPKKGVVARNRMISKNKNRILEENILKTFYHLGEEDKSWFALRPIDLLQQKRRMSPIKLKMGLMRLQKKKLLNKLQNQWSVTQEGLDRGRRIVKIHRLWELYLTEHLNIAPDHVHEDAESIEHIITPELEQKLEEKLQFAKKDPHQSKIPYKPVKEK